MPESHDPTRSLPDAFGPDTTREFDLGQTHAHAEMMAVVARQTRRDDRYILGEEIARGGMGVIHRAMDAVFGREVAIKVLQERYAPGSTTAERFHDEARITGQLQHPAIPPVHDLGTLPDGRPFLAMKLIKGETLDTLLRQRSSPNQDRGMFIAVFEQVCQALAYAHARGVIHRDLKPANVMVGAFGEVQVMDWGLAKVLPPHEQDPPSARLDSTNPHAGEAHSSRDLDSRMTVIASRDQDELLTRDGAVLGTPAFMPPEQAVGDIATIDRRSDVFGLGGILAAILTGKPPFMGESAATTHLMAAAGEIHPCFDRLDTCGADPDYVSLAKRCLAASSADRPADAATVAREIASLRTAAEERARQAELEAVRIQGEQARTAERIKRRKVQRALIGSVTLLIISGLVGGIITSLWRTAESERTIAEQAQASEAEARKQVEIEREKLSVFEYGRSMQVSYQHWRDNNITALKGIVESADPKLRNWEWHYLQRLADPVLMTLTGHLLSTHHVAYSPDGSKIATANWDKSIKIWDAKSGKELSTLQVQGKMVNVANFSPDGTRLLTSYDDDDAKIIDIQTGSVVLTIPIVKGHNRAASYRRDGQRIVTSNGFKEAKVVDAITGKDICVLRGHRQHINAASFSPDGKTILTGSVDHTAKLWDGETGAELRTLKGHTWGLGAASFSPDGTRIVTGSYDTTAKIWDTKTGAELHTLRGHIRAIDAAIFSPDGKTIATGSRDHTIKIWNVETGTEVMSLPGHTQGINSLAYSPDGSQLLSGSADKTAKIWDVKIPIGSFTIPPSTCDIKSATFNHDGSQIYTVAREGILTPELIRSFPKPGDEKLTIRDSTTGKIVLTIPGQFGNITKASISQDGTRVVTPSQNNTAKVWDTRTGAELLTLKGHVDIVNAAAFSPDGSKIVTGSGYHLQKPTLSEVKVWDAQTGAELMTLRGHTRNVMAVSFSPDGKRILTGSWDKTAKVWDVRYGMELMTLKGHTHLIEAATFSSDGTRIVTGCRDQTAKIWDAQTGKELLTLKGHIHELYAANFSPDGSRVITGSWDQDARLWDAKTGAEVMTLKGHKSIVNAASFSPDGIRIITGSADGTVRIWDRRPIRESLRPMELVP